MPAGAEATAAVVISPERWAEFLAEHGIGDTYLQRGYAQSAALLEGGHAVLLGTADAGGAVACVLIVRDIPGSQGLRDATSPYGYGGPVCVGDSPPRAGFSEGVGEWARRERVVAAFVRSHPRWENQDDLLLLGGGETALLTPTVAWRVGADCDLMAGMHKKHRNMARRAVREGVQVAVTPAPDDLAEFRQLYELTMDRQDAAAFYRFPDEYWTALSDGLGEQLILASATLNGQVVAAALCMAPGGWLHYHLGATADAARSIGASNLVLLELAQWAQQHGYERFHLGGGVGGADDSLRAFKLRFDAGAEVPFGIGKVVLDPRRYADLAGTTDTSGFFPPWRA